MNNDNWFKPLTVYGYEFDISPDIRFSDFVNDMYLLNNIIPEPFHIYNILHTFPSDFEDNTHNIELELLSTVVIGFLPDNNLTTTIQLCNDLESYVSKHSIFQNILNTPKFYTGIEWIPDDNGYEDNENYENEEEDDDDDDDEYIDDDFDDQDEKEEEEDEKED